MSFLKSRKFWINVLTGISGITLWYLQMLNPTPTWPFSNEGLSADLYKYLIYPYKVQIGLFLAFLIIILTIALSWVPSKRKKESLLKNILREILLQQFKGDSYNNRFTLFRVKNGFYSLIIHMWRCLLVHLHSHWKRDCLKYYLHNIPNPARKYLHIQLRIGQPFSRGTSTTFIAAETYSEVEGITSLVWLSQKPEYVHLPNISNIDLKGLKSIEEIRNQIERTNVENYMREGKIKDFQKLKTFHRLSTNIWAAPILDRKQETIGVLVYDNCNSNPIFDENESLSRHLVGYTRIIEKILSADI